MLDTQPTADVTIGISSNDLSEGTVSTSSLTFTNANWNTPQIITVTGVDDTTGDGNVSYSIITAAASSADTNYNGLNAADVAVTNQDNDLTLHEAFDYSAGPLVGQNSGLGWSTAWYDGGAPPDDFSVQSGGLSDPTGLLLTSGNSAFSNAANDGNGFRRDVTTPFGTPGTTAWLSFLVRPDTATGIDDYAGVSLFGSAGVYIGSLPGATSYWGMNTTGGGGEVYTSAPATLGATVLLVVRVDFTAGNDTLTLYVNPTPGTGSPDSPVSNTVVKSDVDLGTVSMIGVAQGRFATASQDELRVGSTYALVTPSRIQVSGVSGATTEASGTTSFSVVLNESPTADVTIGISSNDLTEGTVSTSSLTFTSANWNAPQIVTVTGVDDFVDDGNIAYSIITTAAVSADGNYNGLNAADVAVTNTDNDTAGISVSGISGNTTEAGGTATFTVVLDSQPTADVTIGISSNDLTEGTVSTSSLTFTNGNWNVAQVVTVTGVDDLLIDGNIAFTVVTTAAFSSDGNYGGLSAADVAVTNNDNDTYNTVIVDTISDISDGTTSSLAALYSDKGPDGFISLREAIIATNNTANGGSPDEIHFNIAGADPHTINVLSALPTIADTVIIDGWSEADFAGAPVIELNGTGAGAASGLSLFVGSDGSTIRGLVINRFAQSGISIAFSDNHVIAGNYLGTDVTGTAAAANGIHGVVINASSGVTIGGLNAADRNVISGNSGSGITIENISSNTTVIGNYIGTNAAGSAAVANAGEGIRITQSSGDVIGGVVTGASNVISGNTGNGIHVGGTVTNTVIQGNLIGSNAAQTASIANQQNGIRIAGGFGNPAGNIDIGGAAVGAGNLITGNGSHGVELAGGNDGNISIVGNRISNNTGLGIDLAADGVTYNDAEDVDTGFGSLLNFPVLTSVFQNGANLDIDFDVDLPTGNYRIEFFDTLGGLEGSGFGEGQTVVGFANIAVTGAAGYESFSTTLTGVTASGLLNITTTATSADGTFTVFGSTSEFGPQFQGAGVVTVTTASDTNDGDTSNIAALLGNRGADGLISLREAILATNNTANIGGNPDEIRFSIAGAGPHTIQPLSALPIITDAVVLDGTTEPDFAGSPVIELDGSVAGGTAIHVQADGVTLRGLVVNRFGSGSAAIRLEGDSNIVEGMYIGTDITGNAGASNGVGILIQGSNNIIGGTLAAQRNVISANSISAVQINVVSYTGNVLQGNYIGVNAAGNAVLGNAFGGVSASGANTVIGGTTTGAGNVIAGNGAGGLSVSGDGSTVFGNYIGTDASGTLNLGNSGYGIQISGAAGITVGGIGLGEANIIAYNNGPGVTVRATSPAAINNPIRGNSIHSNSGLGIDLIGTAGVTANDPGDVDAFGGNLLQNYPVLTVAVSTGGITSIQGSLNSTASTTFFIDFYSNPAQDPTGYGEGRVYLGSDTVMTDGSGDVSIDTVLAASVTAGHFVTATATDPSGNTSEFALNVTVVSNVIIVDTTADENDGDTSSIAALLATPGGTGISLREAIIATNNTANGGSPDEIWFNITGAGVHTVSPLTALPFLSDAVIIG